jgi:hypothetical protein
MFKTSILSKNLEEMLNVDLPAPASKGFSGASARYPLTEGKARESHWIGKRK